MDEDPWANAHSPRSAPSSPVPAAPRVSAESPASPLAGRVSESTYRSSEARRGDEDEDDSDGDLGRPSSPRASILDARSSAELSGDVARLSVEGKAKEEPEDEAEDNEDEIGSSLSTPNEPPKPAGEVDDFDDVPFDDEPVPEPDAIFSPPPALAPPIGLSSDFSSDPLDSSSNPFAADSPDPFATSSDPFASSSDPSAPESRDTFASPPADGGFDDFDDFDAPAPAADFGDDEGFGDFGDFEDADFDAAPAPAAPAPARTPVPQEPRWVSARVV